ncbi:uncharacterized protein PRCAT00001538001 [Priceomyces carsonii]|uniref:uncharacterized protein n=1 Tax=Priceomyces carsonii TaxID=28549 RepID=UPI002EDA9E01|nr:unnamed protein product [Priceomyces carsonii]
MLTTFNGQKHKKRKLDRISADEDGSEEEDLPDYMKISETYNDIEDPINDEHYLETIDRQALDFDFERICSISLSSVNVYCCLVCGKYFQGRSMSSHAYNHSINMDHHVFVNMNTEKFYVLPNNYEIKSARALKSLADVKNLMNPTYNPNSELPKLSYTLNNEPYDVGYVGLNNISSNDYLNVIIQLLSHIPPIKNFYLNLSSKDNLRGLMARKSELNSEFGFLVRKIWSSHLYKNHVSPQVFLQLVSRVSKKHFSLNKQGSPKQFMVWLVNQLHSQMSKVVKSKETVFLNSCQGRVEVTKIAIDLKEKDSTIKFKLDESSVTKGISNFWILSLDVPKISVFTKKSMITEVSLMSLLKKYDGTTKSQSSPNEVKVYKLLEPLPPYLFFHIDRTLEDTSSEGNSTVVKYPELLDMSSYVGSSHLTNYRLLANIKHSTIPGPDLNNGNGKHKWSIDLRKDNNDWLNINDLEIKECHYELLFLDESYIQVWEKLDMN